MQTKGLSLSLSSTTLRLFLGSFKAPLPLSPAFH